MKRGALLKAASMVISRLKPSIRSGVWAFDAEVKESFLSVLTASCWSVQEHLIRGILCLAVRLKRSPTSLRALFGA